MLIRPLLLELFELIAQILLGLRVFLLMLRPVRTCRTAPLIYFPLGLAGSTLEVEGFRCLSVPTLAIVLECCLAIVRVRGALCSRRAASRPTTAGAAAWRA